MDLRVTRVSPCLEKKLKVAGFEVPDLLGILFVVSVLNFLTGSLNQRLLTVWGPGFLMAATLWIGKRGKPDGYLLHFLQFYTQPKHLLAFPDPGESAARFVRSLVSIEKKKGRGDEDRNA